MADIRSTYIHERQVKCFIDRHELERVVREHALRQAGYDPAATSLTVKVKFEDETAGSPSYSVGTKARVEITEALLVEPRTPEMAPTNDRPSERSLRTALTIKGAEMLGLIDKFGPTDGNDKVRAEVDDVLAHAIAGLSYAAPLDR